MEKYLGKQYKLEKSENFEEYLKFLEVGFLQRKNGKTMFPISCLVQNADGSYTFTQKVDYSERHSTSSTFRVGENFVEERADKVKVTSTIFLEGNKMIHTQIERNGRKSTHIREFTDDTLTAVTTAEGWDGKCVRTYRLIDPDVPRYEDGHYEHSYIGT